MKTCTELLEALRAKANFGKLRAFPSGDVGQGTGHNYEHIGAVGNGPRASYAVLAVNHFAACVKALEKKHDQFWEGEGHSCEDGGGPYLDDCKALAALRTDLEAAVAGPGEVK